ncbi:cytochrome b5-related protein-like [Neodiprion fabricii]|uniref:cytochrome b5-related protein-like n=1 Tax=Neodiprion fabricii TaxID=2872261 RepID=UPI001ED913AD|nr:cytochrome b5-related protein-like [Neodiprion fabricii]
MGPKEKKESTLIGLKYPSFRDKAWKTGASWLDGKRKDDGIEGLWRVGDKLYDLAQWVGNHPGGAEWLTLTKGTDITEAFEAHHITSFAEQLLPKFYVRDATTPRSSPLTFKPDGFYRVFKSRVREALKGVDFHKPAKLSNLMSDSLCAGTLALCVTASATQSWAAIFAAAIFLTWTAVAGHNYMHLRDSFRMAYMDLSLLSSKEWRITHCLSHHLYANSILDFELSMFEPFFDYVPHEKGFITRRLSWLYTPSVYAGVYFMNGVKRIYSLAFEWGTLDYRDLTPFLIPALMCAVAPPSLALAAWMKVIAISSFYFVLIGANAAHHHPDIYHDGDVHREDLDWGLAQIDAVRDRVEIEPSRFLIITHFGSHTLHHLLPTVDHSYLHLCEPAFEQTCKEFGVNTDLWTQWKLFKGQFMQLQHTEPKKTPNTR